LTYLALRRGGNLIHQVEIDFFSHQIAVSRENVPVWFRCGDSAENARVNDEDES
jgi:hypothetical protein